MLNQKGFSIAQVAIAMSIMSIMGVGLSTMITNQTNTVFYLEDQMSQQSFKRELENLLLDNTVCSESLQNTQIPTNLVTQAPNSGTSFVIRNNAGDILYDPATNTANTFENLRVSNIRVQNSNITDPAVGGEVNLVVDVERLRGNNRQALKSIIIKKNVTVDPSLRVVACTGGSNDSGWGECLENIGGAYLGRSGFNSPLVTQARVPSNAKVLQIAIPGKTCSGGSSSRNNDWSSSSAGGTLTLPLDGKIVMNGRPIVAGGTLTLDTRTSMISYMGVQLIQDGTCSSTSSRPVRVLAPSSDLSFCRKATDYRAPAGSNPFNNFSTITVTYWD